MRLWENVSAVLSAALLSSLSPALPAVTLLYGNHHRPDHHRRTGN